MTKRLFHSDDMENEVVRVLQRQQSLRRITILVILFLACFALVVFRLAVIQIRDSAMLREIAFEQYQSRETLAPIRGLIFDRNLSILASNLIEYRLTADPGVIQRPDTVAMFLAKHFPGSVSFYREKLSDRTRRYVVLHNRLPESAAAVFASWRCYGVSLVKVPRRYYTFGRLASCVLGYTNIENRGQSGVELQFDADLAGKPGFIVYQRDANGRRRPEVDYPQREPVNGRSVVLTIDQAYQSIAEEELVRGVENAAARSGRCVILQPRTGEILALANVPSIDPNDLSSYTADEIANAKNRVVTDVYEPGSTFKLVAMSAALNEGLYKPDDVLDGNNGCWEYAPGQKPIRDEHGFGRISLRDAFIYSSNIISAKLAEKLGAERFYTYARNFGFGLRTGIELPGEVRGELRKPTAWDGSTLKYLAFGYGLSATSLQIACAYAAIANDGVLMRPFIRRWLLDEERNVIDETTPQVIRRVVSSETAATMRDFMRGVVERGTATKAAIPGVDIAGKTGTSQRLVGDRYSSTSHVASFVGFFPASNPKILILVLLEEPKNGYYGGIVAAPVFRNIALRIITSRPEFAPPARPVPEWIDSVRVPDLCGLHREVAGVLARAYGLEVRTRGSGDIVCRQSPAPGNRTRRRETVTLELAPAEQRSSLVRVPDVTNIPVRRAAARLAATGLHASIAGSGIVFSQLPAAGELIERGAPCTLFAEPRRGNPVHVY